MAAPRSEVSLSLMQYLTGEAVSQMARSMEGQEGGEEELHAKLRRIGFQIGYRFAERATKERALFVNTLDVMKFICKDFWRVVFQKQVDKLQTNHRGVFVLQDYSFSWLTTLSCASDGDGKAEALRYLIIPCSIIRGALSNLGVDSVVNADIAALPGASFTIKVRT
eukprot:PLAT15365.1.p1 GENE.PLAT15365.1~~PLAT15365.1.p1  ORF type:complete len:181 (+),score=59.71 PLAT15365.1:48-545(+)